MKKSDRYRHELDDHNHRISKLELWKARSEGVYYALKGARGLVIAAVTSAATVAAVLVNAYFTGS